MSHSLPTLFIPHGGGPCFFMEWTMGPPDTWHKMAKWLGELPGTLGAVPKAIVVISGHWEAPHFRVTSNPRPRLIYDYAGFPPETYQLKYPAPGSPELAERIVDLLGSAGLPARSDPDRGFDHGVFIPFKVIYPQAEIPIVQMSLHSSLDPELHLQAGRALKALREEGVLIVASGMSYHNLRGMMVGRDIPESDQFDHWLSEAIASRDPEKRNEKLKAWASAPSARAAHPHEEHLIPLMVAAGAAGDDLGEKIFSDRVMGATVSAYRFG